MSLLANLFTLKRSLHHTFSLSGSAFNLVSFYLISSAKFTNPKKDFLCNTLVEVNQAIK